jgi:replicative DNA helicase
LKNIPPRKFAELLVSKYYNRKGKQAAPAIDLENQISHILSENLCSYQLFGKKEANSVAPITTGFPILDEKMGDSLRSGSVYIVGARPSIGKSLFSLNLVNNNISAGVRSVYVSFQESAITLITKLLAIRARIPVNRIQKGWLQEKDWAKISKALATLHEVPLLIMAEEKERSYDRLICELWRIVRDGPARLIVIDPLDLLYRDHFFGLEQSIGLKSVMKGFQWIAKETNATFLVLCQLKNSLESRPDKTPQISDLYGGKQLADFAQGSFLLYREYRYQPELENNNLSVYIIRSNGQRLMPICLDYYYDEYRLSDSFYPDYESLFDEAEEMEDGNETESPDFDEEIPF